MIQRGRKPTAALTVVSLPHRLPEPPADLTAEQVDVWKAVVATKPSDWFGPDTLPLLAAYCRACVEHAWISGQIDAKKIEWLADDEGLKRYDTATRLQERQARLMTSLATKMRLTQQSQYGARGAARESGKAGGSRPWGAIVEG